VDEARYISHHWRSGVLLPPFTVKKTEPDGTTLAKPRRFIVTLRYRAKVNPVNSASEMNFQAQVDRQRGRHRLFMKVAATGFGLVGGSLLVPERWLVWIAAPGAALVFIGLMIFFTAPGLRCPDCGQSAEGFGSFCPVCGTAGLRRILTAAKCDGCHHTLDHYKTRNYAIHFCTHCGRLLDRRGAGTQVRK
jgi:hypothetical protein